MFANHRLEFVNAFNYESCHGSIVADRMSSQRYQIRW